MIIKVKEKIFDPYARIPNRILNDSKLSWKSKGLLAYCMSKPENWEIRVADIINKSTDGESSVRSALKELMILGYCQGTQLKNKDGSIGGYQYDFADYPYFKNPHVENPHVENHNHNNTDRINNNNKLLLEDIPKPIGKRPKSVPFEEIIAILEKQRPEKKFIRRNKYGAVEKAIGKFYRENDKDTQCFYDLCDRLEESDFLMGRNGHNPPIQIKDPSWSWIFKLGNDGVMNAIKILEGKYSNDRMEFALQKAKKEALTEVIIVGGGGKQKVDLSDSKYKVVGFDDVQNLKKVVEVQ
jgi:hypothetical protein